jgi:hypothetical protein
MFLPPWLPDRQITTRSTSSRLISSRRRSYSCVVRVLAWFAIAAAFFQRGLAAGKAKSIITPRPCFYLKKPREELTSTSKKCPDWALCDLRALLFSEGGHKM